MHQGDIFYVKLDKDYIKIKIELILAMKEGAIGSLTCKLYNTFNSNFLCKIYKEKLKFFDFLKFLKLIFLRYFNILLIYFTDICCRSGY